MSSQVIFLTNIPTNQYNATAFIYSVCEILIKSIRFLFRILFRICPFGTRMNLKVLVKTGDGGATIDIGRHFDPIYKAARLSWVLGIQLQV